MRIRLYSAFASNNSGSYTLVGTFRDPAVAEEVAGLLREAIAAHDAWHAEHEWDEDGPAPIDDFVAAHGLAPGKHGRGDDWPCHGPAPEVVTSGHQVLVHAPYTVTCPTVFGELLYKKGGRVMVELDHAHERVCVEIAYHAPGLTRDDPSHEAALEAFEAEVRAALPALIEPSEHDRRPRVEPVWHPGFWGNRQLSVVFRDLIEGVRAVGAIAARHGLALWLRVWEGAHGVGDPLAPLRTERVPWGPFRVILWQLGPDRVAAMKAARAALGCGLAEAKAALADLPRELCVNVSKRHAEDAVAALVAAGCDAEIVAPTP